MIKNNLKQAKDKAEKVGQKNDFEKETIINFNKEEKEASIFTYEKSWQTYLEKKLKLKPILNNGFGAKEYIIDKSMIRMPLAPTTSRNKKRKELACVHNGPKMPKKF